MVPGLRDVGTTGLRISPVGIGTWALGGAGWQGSWGAQRDEDSMDAILCAVEAGTNWIDTAPVYGVGHAEEIVGRAVRKLPAGERPLILTKCGFGWDEANPDNMWQSLTRAAIRSECEASLRRLGVEQIDLYQVHWPASPGATDQVPLEETWAAMAELADEGKVRAIGVSNFDVEQLERCEQVRHVDSVQPPFSLIARDAAADVVPWADRNGTAAIAYSPMQSGLLTDRASVEWAASFGQDDWRRDAPEFASPRLERNLALRDALRPIARRHSVSTAAIAVAWVLAVPGVTGAIVGGRSAEQVRTWTPAAHLTLSQDDLAEIDAALRSTRAGEGWSVYPNPNG